MSNKKCSEQQTASKYSVQFMNLQRASFHNKSYRQIQKHSEKNISHLSSIRAKDHPSPYKHIVSKHQDDHRKKIITSIKEKATFDLTLNQKNDHMFKSQKDSCKIKLPKKKNQENKLKEVAQISQLHPRKSSYLEIKNRKMLKTENNSLSNSNIKSNYATTAIRKNREADENKLQTTMFSCVKLKKQNISQSKNYEKRSNESVLGVETVKKYEKQKYSVPNQNMQLNSLLERTKSLLAINQKQRQVWFYEKKQYLERINCLEKELKQCKNKCSRMLEIEK